MSSRLKTQNDVITNRILNAPGHIGQQSSLVRMGFSQSILGQSVNWHMTIPPFLILWTLLRCLFGYYPAHTHVCVKKKRAQSAAGSGSVWCVVV